MSKLYEEKYHTWSKDELITFCENSIEELQYKQKRAKSPKSKRALKNQLELFNSLVGNLKGYVSNYADEDHY